MNRCPACQRTFESGGFCPYDGTPLVQVRDPDQPTVGTEQFSTHQRPSDVESASRPRPASRGGAGDPFGEIPEGFRAVSAKGTPGQPIIRPPKPTAKTEYDALVGQTLDSRYRILRKIGEGGMGVVYDARHAVIERPLAIKVLRREVMRDGAAIQRFVQEARAASRIGHPSIVDVTDFGQTPDGMTYSVMEYVDGITLSKAIKTEGSLPTDRAIPIGAQIARALGAAHAKGIIHRDLKPENVFLTQRDGRPDFVKIVDFGIAKVQPMPGAGGDAPKLTRTGSVFGTPEYMAPEQAAGRGDTDHRVDIYALGTILYEMASGKTPHKGPSLVATVAAQMLDPIPPLSPDVPAPLVRVIMKALAKSRDERYQTMAELATALEAAHGEIRSQIAPAAAPDSPTLAPAAEPDATAARRARPLTRPLHEPEFVAGGPILALPDPLPEPEPPPPSRWPLVLAALALLSVLGAVGAWWHSRANRAAPATAPASAPRDAAMLAPAPTPTPAASDAAIAIPPIAPVDAAIAPAHPDAREPLAPADAGVLAKRHPSTVTVEVLTRPAEANVFEDHTFRGPSGVRLTEPWGTRMTIACRAPHMAGSAAIVFDGSRDAVMCTAVRIPMCVPGLHNPYDNCEP